MVFWCNKKEVVKEFNRKIEKIQKHTGKGFDLQLIAVENECVGKE